jgi:hypothetical protein
MSRYNIYKFIHKGLRRALFKQLMELGQLDETNQVAVSECLNSVQKLLQTFNQHHQREDSFIQPLLPLFSITVQDHLYCEQTLRELDHQIEQINSIPAVINAPALHELYLQLSLFCAAQLRHMHEEETQMMEHLWQHHSDEELHSVYDQLINSLSNAEQLQSMRLVLPALTETERLSLLLRLQKQMPESAFFALVGEVQQELNATQQHTIHKYVHTIINTACTL